MTINLKQTEPEKMRLSNVRGKFDEMIDKKWVSNLNIATNLCVRIVYELLKGEDPQIRGAILSIVREEYVSVAAETTMEVEEEHPEDE